MCRLWFPVEYAGPLPEPPALGSNHMARIIWRESYGVLEPLLPLAEERLHGVLQNL